MRNKSGFTLLEVITALIILAFVITAIIIFNLIGEKFYQTTKTQSSIMNSAYYAIQQIGKDIREGVSVTIGGGGEILEITHWKGSVIRYEKRGDKLYYTNPLRGIAGEVLATNVEEFKAQRVGTDSVKVSLSLKVEKPATKLKEESSYEATFTLRGD
jgi:prepilin-type N-terminal cleavage/methylation domain-containing protein